MPECMVLQAAYSNYSIHECFMPLLSDVYLSKFLSAGGTDSLHIGSWLIGAGVGLGGE